MRLTGPSFRRSAAGAEQVHLRRSGYCAPTQAQNALNKTAELLADDADEPDLCRVHIAELTRPASRPGGGLRFPS